MNKFSKMIERLEDLILAGIGIPLTPWTVIHGDKLVPLLDRIRESLPEEIIHAQGIMEQRDRILEDAQRKARQVLQDAKAQAEAMLSESELMAAIQGEAERIRHTVLEECEAIQKKNLEECEALRAKTIQEVRQVREDADRYAESVLTSMEKTLFDFQNSLKQGQQNLRQAKVDSAKRGTTLMLDPTLGPKNGKASPTTAAEAHAHKVSTAKDAATAKTLVGL